VKQKINKKIGVKDSKKVVQELVNGRCV